MIRKRIPEGKELEMVKQAFAEIETVEFLVNPKMEATGRTGIAASKLYAYVRGVSERGQETEEAILQFPALCRAYGHMVRGTAIYTIPETIAASTVEFPERQSEGCRVRVEPSRAEPDQYYLIIEVDDGRPVPTIISIADTNEHWEQVMLPAPRRGVVQVMVTADSGIPAMLRDPKTAIYLS